MHNARSEVIIRIVAEAIALLMLPKERLRKSAIGKVSVFIVIAPAKISTAPNSAIPLAHVMTVLPMIPDLDIGKVTFKKASNGVLPSV
jgi:hypothetical protein